MRTAMPKLTTPRVPKVKDRYKSEVKQEDQRLTGVAPRSTSAYQESPAKFLPKAQSFGIRSLGMAKKAK